VQSALALAERVVARERVPLEAVPVVTVAREELMALPLDHRAGFMLTRIDGRSPVRAILDIAAMPHDEALALLGTLETLGALRFLVDEDEKTIRRASQQELAAAGVPAPPRRLSQPAPPHPSAPPAPGAGAAIPAHRLSQPDLDAPTKPRRSSNEFPAVVAARRASQQELAAVPKDRASSRPRASPPPPAPLKPEDETVRRASVWPANVPRDPSRATPVPSAPLTNEDKTVPLAAPWLKPAPLPSEEKTAEHSLDQRFPRFGQDEKTEPGFSLFDESDTKRDQKKQN